MGDLQIKPESLATFKKLVCLLSCQPRDMGSQLPQALDCLRTSLNAMAVGIHWPEANGRKTLRLQSPARYRMGQDLRRALVDATGSSEPAWGERPSSWLAVPMKVGGSAKGRLWAVCAGERQFSQEEREFMAMAGNQLALAMENSRLYEEVQQLAVRRGQLLRRVIAAQDERCRRISRELHDEISQSLAAMALDLETVQVAGDRDRGVAMERLGDLRQRLQSVLGEVNRIILDLRPTLLEDMGLLSALRWYATQRLEPLGVSVHVHTEGTCTRLLPHVETTLYRIAQEAVTNVAKHAGARNLWLWAKPMKRHFALSIRDDGCGFDQASVMADPCGRTGIGLFGMKERAALVGGTVRVWSVPGSGTRVVVRVPYEGGDGHADDSSLAG